MSQSSRLTVKGLLMLCAILLFGCDYTTVSPGFSQRALDGTKVGDDVHDVYKALGKPLRATTIALSSGDTIPGAAGISADLGDVLIESQNPKREIVLEYSLPRAGEENYYQHAVYLQGGKVVRVVRNEWYSENVFDWRSR